MTLVLEVVAYIRFFFGHDHVIFALLVTVTEFSKQRDSFSFWSLSRDNLFFGRLVQKVVTLRFSDAAVQKTTQQLDGNCDETSDTQFLSANF